MAEKRRKLAKNAIFMPMTTYFSIIGHVYCSAHDSPLPETFGFFMMALKLVSKNHILKIGVQNGRTDRMVAKLCQKVTDIL